MTETVHTTASSVPPEDTVTLPRIKYEALLERLEDLEDSLAAAQVDERDTIPLEDAERLLSGEVSRLRYWRERRSLSQNALAEASGVPQSYISEIEHGRKPGSVATFKALAGALDRERSF